MNLLKKRSKQQLALAKAPGMYAEEDPDKAFAQDQIVFNQRTRFSVEANHWKLVCVALLATTIVAIATRQPPPSIVKAYGVSADTSGHAEVRELSAYRPDSQAIRVSLKEMTERWFTIEPVLHGDIRSSRMALDIKAVQLQMEGKAQSQFVSWLKSDAPFEAIAADPKLTREVNVADVSILDDSTAVVSFTTSTAQGDTDPPTVQKWHLTVRFEVQPPASDAALSTNPFGIYIPLYTLEKSA